MSSATAEVDSSDYSPERDWRRVEPQPDIPTAARLADLMTSGLVGRPLERALHVQFPAAKRADVYFAVSMVMAMMEADLVGYEFELRNPQPDAVAA